MLNRIGPYLGFAVLLITLFVLRGSGFSASMSASHDAALNDKCIRCHLDIFQNGLESPWKHQPCFERQCIVCHLASKSAWRASSSTEASVTMTGVPVDEQGSQWRKTMFFVSEGRQTRHTAVLSGLADSQPYRFRIIASDSPKPGTGKEEAGLWLGLIPDEVSEFYSGPGQGDGAREFEAGSPGRPAIERLGKEVVISWQPSPSSFGWVELQTVKGLNLQQSAAEPTEAPLSGKSGEEQHPLLVDPEYAAINLCYTCHPESSLGLSHPVRVFATGVNTRIPETLPTVKNGMMTCATCHDPHGSTGKGLVREVIVTKLCVTCHYNFNRTSKSTMF